LMPAFYLIHFFYGLSVQGGPTRGEETASKSEVRVLPASAKLYLGMVIASGLGLLSWGALEWESAGLVRFTTFLAIALVASGCKVRLPGMTETVSLNFVVLLAAITELPLAEVVFLAAASALVQSVWKAKVRPQAVQIWFGLTSMALDLPLLPRRGCIRRTDDGGEPLDRVVRGFVGAAAGPARLPLLPASCEPHSAIRSATGPCVNPSASGITGGNKP